MANDFEVTEEEYFGEDSEYWQQERLPDSPGKTEHQVQADSAESHSLT